MTVTIIWNYPELDRLLHQRSGAVGAHIANRANSIMLAAKTQAGGSTGALKTSIHTNFERTAIGPRVLVGSPLHYAQMHHDGTKPHVIVAKNGGLLKFRGRSGVAVYAKSVLNPGTKPNRYLVDNLPLAVV